MQSDPVIMAANGVSFALAMTLLFFQMPGATRCSRELHESADGSDIACVPWVAPSGLNMSVRKRTDPRVSPGRWNGERLDASENIALCKP
jgi:hypothetical protein